MNTTWKHNEVRVYCFARYIELPVPRDCYSEDVTYPLDDSTLLSYDQEKFHQARSELVAILERAEKGHIEVCSPLLGVYDPDIHETRNELGVSMLHSFNAVIGNFIDTVTSVTERREHSLSEWDHRTGTFIVQNIGSRAPKYGKGTNESMGKSKRPASCNRTRFRLFIPSLIMWLFKV